MDYRAERENLRETVYKHRSVEVKEVKQCDQGRLEGWKQLELETLLGTHTRMQQEKRAAAEEQRRQKKKKNNRGNELTIKASKGERK
jgi:hypothetical protein